MLVSRLGHQSSKNDIWGIGCIALQFLSCRTVRLSRRHPYNKIFLYDRMGRSSLVMDRLELVLQRKMENLDNLHEEEVLSTEAIDFVESCLQLNE